MKVFKGLMPRLQLCVADAEISRLGQTLRLHTGGPGQADDKADPNGRGMWFLREGVSGATLSYKEGDKNLVASVSIDSPNATFSDYGATGNLRYRR